MNNLFKRSIEIIRSNQSPSGAYLASPNFPTYHYSWFRDGAFIAYAMDLAGEHESSARFHDWAANTILRNADVAARAVSLARTNDPLSHIDILHTRYTVAGEPASDEEWPNFQLDGFGTWLWALAQHCRRSDRTPADTWIEAGRCTADYLAALWQRPCYDCWEEYPDKIHIHTLAAIYGGLKAYQEISRSDHSVTLQQIAGYIDQYGSAEGHYVKFVGSHTVDASLVGLAVPYEVVAAEAKLMCETIERIETSLVRGGGVHRFPTDTYYGGGEWVLLAGWLGWYYARLGEVERARALLTWIEAQADAKGNLPEQVPATLNDPNYYEPWVNRWGSIANPLLWSHAMYIILHQALETV